MGRTKSKSTHQRFIAACYAYHALMKSNDYAKQKLGKAYTVSDITTMFMLGTSNKRFLLQISLSQEPSAAYFETLYKASRVQQHMENQQKKQKRKETEAEIQQHLKRLAELGYKVTKADELF